LQYFEIELKYINLYQGPSWQDAENSPMSFISGYNPILTNHEKSGLYVGMKNITNLIKH